MCTNIIKWLYFYFKATSANATMEPCNVMVTLQNELIRFTRALNELKGKRSSPKGMIDVAKIAYQIGNQIEW